MNENLARYRIPARMGAVLLSYLLYLWAADARVVPAILLGVGVMLVAWAIIDEIMLPKRERLSLLTVGSAILGLGLAGVGLYLTLR